MYESIYNLIMKILGLFKVFSGVVNLFRRDDSSETFASE